MLVASLPFQFRGEAFTTIVKITNILPTSVLNNNNPYETLFYRKPDYHSFRIFGCACYPLLRPYNKRKLDFRSFMWLFLGYNSNHKGYICLSTIGRTNISWHVIFNENLFPYSLNPNPFKSTNFSTNNQSSPTLPLTIIQTDRSDIVDTHSNDIYNSPTSSNVQGFDSPTFQGYGDSCFTPSPTHPSIPSPSPTNQ